MEKAPIVLLTDYGNRDPYAGILKGVILGIAPETPVIDLTHEIMPGDLLQAAVTLWMSRSYFPPGTVFCCVVDPGVGTDRRAVIVESGDHWYVGPDNGLFSFVAEEDSTAWLIEMPKSMQSGISVTFHGRDIFAPAAARLAKGIPGSLFETQVESLVRLVQPVLHAASDCELHGEILFADRFGNLLTSLGAFSERDGDVYEFSPWLQDAQTMDLNRNFSRGNSRLILPDGGSLDWVRTFADKPVGEPATLVGSSGLLEVVANQEDAARILGLRRGDRITLLQTGDC